MKGTQVQRVNQTTGNLARILAMYNSSGQENAIAEYDRSLAAAPARIAPILEHTLGILGENQDCVDFPQLPRKEDGDPEQSEHRPNSMDFEQPFPWGIARKVGRREFPSEPNAIDQATRPKR